MSQSVEFFKKVYGSVPDWVAKMDRYLPESLDLYTELRGHIMKDGHLSKKAKELILVGVNAARRYERSMLYHTRGAVDAGATLQELAEVLSVCILSRGLPSWLEGIKAIDYASGYLADKETKSETKKSEQGDGVEDLSERSISYPDLEACLDYYEKTFGMIPKWVKNLSTYQPEVLLHYTNLRHSNLRDGVVSRKLKELVLVAINTAERYPEGVRIHTEGAISCGATQEELAECHMVSFLTAGIPAWFEGSDFLK